jgi:hypothetical protein
VRSVTLRIGPADDDELLAVEAFGFDPDPAVAWCIGPIRLLRDGALQAQLAGLRAEGRTVTGNVLAVAQPAGFLFATTPFGSGAEARALRLIELGRN